MSGPYWVHVDLNNMESYTSEWYNKIPSDVCILDDCKNKREGIMGNYCKEHKGHKRL